MYLCLFQKWQVHLCKQPLKLPGNKQTTCIYVDGGMSVKKQMKGQTDFVFKFDFLQLRCETLNSVYKPQNTGNKSLQEKPNHDWF